MRCARCVRVQARGMVSEHTCDGRACHDHVQLRPRSSRCDRAACDRRGASGRADQGLRPSQSSMPWYFGESPTASLVLSFMPQQ